MDTPRALPDLAQRGQGDMVDPIGPGGRNRNGMRDVLVYPAIAMLGGGLESFGDHLGRPFASSWTFAWPFARRA